MAFQRHITALLVNSVSDLVGDPALQAPEEKLVLFSLSLSLFSLSLSEKVGALEMGGWGEDVSQATLAKGTSLVGCTIQKAVSALSPHSCRTDPICCVHRAKHKHTGGKLQL